MEENLKQKSTQINSDFTKAQELGFNSNDFIRITNRNINLETVSNQFQLLINGLPKINIDRPAILNDGIEPLSVEQAKYFATIFDGKKKNLKIINIQILKYVQICIKINKNYTFMKIILVFINVILILI